MASNPPEKEGGQAESTADSQPREQAYSPDELAGDVPNQGQAPADINLDLILDVPVSVSLHVGSTEITIRDLLQLVEGSIVALDRAADQPMDVLVNGTLIAHGEIVVVDDDFGVRVTDVVSAAERIRNVNQVSKDRT